MSNPYCWLHLASQKEGFKEMEDFYLCNFCNTRKHKKNLVFLRANYHENDGIIEQQVWQNRIICKKCIAGNSDLLKIGEKL